LRLKGIEDIFAFV